MLKIEDFDYNLPSELIAQEPIFPRDQARLLLVDKKRKSLKDENFFNLDKILKSSDLLVINDTKVFPARLLGHKLSGGRIEVFLLKEKKANTWQCLLKGKVKINSEIILSKNLKAIVLKKNKDNTYLLEFNLSGQSLKKEIKEIGQTPLPPYIKKGRASYEDKINYQTIFANQKQEKSVAAPTAGLHFTQDLLNKLEKKDIEIIKITLHVGLGTFAPVKTDNILEHKMHEERIIIKNKEKQKILEAKKEKRRVVAVGTTVCRALETLASNLGEADNNEDFVKDTDIFIYPGFKFKITDALLTNFHLPKSTLLMLVSALAGSDLIKAAYNRAIRQKYRFYSYGDGMLIY